MRRVNGKLSSCIIPYKKPEPYFLNWEHMYYTCKKLLQYKEDDSVLKKICQDLYEHELEIYKTNRLINNVGICSVFYYELKSIANSIITDDVKIVDFNKVFTNSYNKFYNPGAHIEETMYEMQTQGLNADVETVESIKEFMSIKGKHGIYFLYSENGNLAYIGKSSDLSYRIQSSLSNKKLSHFRYYITKTMADANIYEVYLISKLNPPMNGDSITDDYPTFELPEITIPEKMYYYKYTK